MKQMEEFLKWAELQTRTAISAEITNRVRELRTLIYSQTNPVSLHTKDSDFMLQLNNLRHYLRTGQKGLSTRAELLAYNHLAAKLQEAGEISEEEFLQFDQP